MPMDEELLKKRALLLVQEGLRHQKLGDLTRAVDLYTQSLEVCPTAESYLNLGRLNAARGQIIQAVQEFEQALEFVPNDANCLAALQYLRKMLN